MVEILEPDLNLSCNLLNMAWCRGFAFPWKKKKQLWEFGITGHDLPPPFFATPSSIRKQVFAPVLPPKPHTIRLIIESWTGKSCDRYNIENIRWWITLQSSCIIRLIWSFVSNPTSILVTRLTPAQRKLRLIMANTQIFRSYDFSSFSFVVSVEFSSFIFFCVDGMIQTG